MNCPKPATTSKYSTMIQILENVLKLSTLDVLSRNLVGEFTTQQNQLALDPVYEEPSPLNLLKPLSKELLY